MRLAARGTRNMDDGELTIEDKAERAQLRRQAAKIYVESVLVAVALTLLLFAIPLLDLK